MRPISAVSIPGVLSALILLPTLSQAQGAPDTLSFQGYLTDAVGNPITDPSVSMTLNLYRNGVSVWEEVHANVSVDEGVFHLLLGTSTALDTVAFNTPLELGISVDGDDEISPRTPLAAAPYAKALPGLYTLFRDDGLNVGYNVIGGGWNNSVGANAVSATIAGGGGFEDINNRSNAVQSDYGTIGGGGANFVYGEKGTIAGGFLNQAGSHAAVGGGAVNVAGEYGAVGGGGPNKALGTFSAIPGGSQNYAWGHSSFAAGFNARANHDGSFVWSDRSATGGNDTTGTTGPNQFIIRAAGGVGIGTSAPTSPLTVDGMVESLGQGFKFPDGTVLASAAGLVSGWSLTGNAGTNPATDFIGTTDSTAFEIRINGLRRFRIEPGRNTEFGTVISPNVVMGASNNEIAAGIAGATIGGGGGVDDGFDAKNRVESNFTTIGGGRNNTASGGWASTIGGGYLNQTGDDYATVPGGRQNAANGYSSFAAGYKAQALNDGSFVWNDRSFTFDPLSSTGPNQFLIGAAGGVGIGTNSPNTQLTVVGKADIDSLGLGTSTLGARLDILGGNYDLAATEGDVRIGTAENRLKIGVATGGAGRGRAFLRSEGLVNEIRLGADDTDVVKINKTDGLSPVADNTYPLGTSTRQWTEVWVAAGAINSSDRRLKTNIDDLDYGLDQVMSIRPVSFEWKAGTPTGRHLGFIAQELESVVPEVVEAPSTGEERYGVRYAELVPLLFKAIQEQQNIIEEQASALVMQQTTLEAQEARIAKLEAHLQP